MFSLNNGILMDEFLVSLLLPYVHSILELVQRCLADEERPESVIRMSLGLIGDLADAFPSGQIKQLLLTDWLAQTLRQKTRLSAETKKTLRWAREVSLYSDCKDMVFC